MGADEAHLVVFNRDEEVSWEEKIWQEKAVYGERVIRMWGALFSFSEKLPNPSPE